MLGTAMATYRNQDLAEAFDELAELTILDEGDPQSFRVRAYENAARAIAGADVEAATLTLAQLQKLEGIGKSGATKVRELVDTGRMAKLEELRLKHPLEVRALAKLPGIGPKTVTKLRAEANVHSCGDCCAKNSDDQRA
jgi:DNA polymerase (family X)